jgi:surface protein
MASGLKTMSGRQFIMSWGVPVPLPIAATLDPEVYEGAMVYGADGILYYSDGVEWAPPVETPVIQRPYALTPTNAIEQSQLRLSDFVSTDPGVTQTGIFFEVASDPDFANILFTRNVDSTDASLYQMTADDGLDAFQRIYWRARYRGTGSNESRLSVPFSQIYPPEINTPEPVTSDSSLAATLEVTPYDSAFGYQYAETQWEIYDNADGTGTPVYSTVTTGGATLLTPEIADAGAFWFRARYLGIDITIGDYGQSEWSVLRRYVQPPLATVWTIDTSLISGTEFRFYSQGTGGTIEVDWGDGTVETLNVDDVNIHDYGVDGVYEIKVKGNIGGRLRIGGYAGISDAVTRCDAISFQSNITSFDEMFARCANITFVPTQIPPGVTNFSDCFISCPNFNAPIGLWDVSNATRFDAMFNGCSLFNQDVGAWDVGKATSFHQMFRLCYAFNNGGSPSINEWDTRNVTMMHEMFEQANAFNQPIGDWDTSSVTIMKDMFFGADVFNQNIGNWNVGNVTNMYGMFYFAVGFNNGGSPSIANWNTSSVTDFSNMFRNALSFNQPIGSWDVSNANTLGAMFRDQGAFNQDIGAWDVSNAASKNGITGIFYNASAFNNGGSPSINNWVTTGQTNFDTMFYSCEAFNQPIGNWDVSAGTTFNSMFRFCNNFNQSVSDWDVSSAVAMSATFRDCPNFRNADDPGINNWNTSNITNMAYMMYGNKFNQPIGNWDVSNVTTMEGMFSVNPEFNQDLSNWDVSSVRFMTSMFNQAYAFDNGKIAGVGTGTMSGWNTASLERTGSMFRLIGGFDTDNFGPWIVTGLTDASNMFQSVTLDTTDYDALLTGWEGQAVQNGVAFAGGNSKYSAGAPATARQALIDDHLWTITDGGPA